MLYPASKEVLWIDELQNFVEEEHTVLEIGLGSGKGKQNKRYPKAAAIFGMDLDERVLDNPYLTSAKCISAYDISKELDGVTFDVIYSHMVAEHIDDAKKFLAIQLQKIKRDGVIFHSTVSRFYQASIIDDFVPVGVKSWLIAKLGSGRKSDDIFSAHYQLNS